MIFYFYKKYYLHVGKLMSKLLSIFLLFISLNAASSYPCFSEKELKNIKDISGDIAKNRVNDYTQTVDSFSKFSKEQQLIRVNAYLNQLLPQVDMLNQNERDHWETPKEFLTCGYGDCEDYAIIKYFTLLKLGFPKDKLYMTAVKEKYSGGYHMVLSYFKTKNKPPLILDNLSFRILDLKTREDLEVDLFINESGTYKINKYNNLVRTGCSPDKFKKLILKVKEEN